MDTDKKLTPAFFFLSFAMLAALLCVFSATINLSFTLLNHVFPDALNGVYTYGYSTGDYESMRSSVAMLIIVFPLLLLFLKLWHRTYTTQLTQRNTTLRKWILYVIIFLCAVTAIVDLVVLVRYFLSGETTSRFMLKVLTVLIASGITALYFLRILMEKKIKNVVFAAAVSILLLALIICSFMVMGSPKTQRALRFDQQRIQALESIQYQIINNWQQKQSLPLTLEELESPLMGYTLPKDPEFQKGLKYEYMKKSELIFDLCATFSEPLPKGYVESYDFATSVEHPSPGGASYHWDHDAGRTCFERTIDPKVYPPFKN